MKLHITFVTDECLIVEEKYPGEMPNNSDITINGNDYVCLAGQVQDDGKYIRIYTCAHEQELD